MSTSKTGGPPDGRRQKPSRPRNKKQPRQEAPTSHQGLTTTDLLGRYDHGWTRLISGACSRQPHVSARLPGQTPYPSRRYPGFLPCLHGRQRTDGRGLRFDHVPVPRIPLRFHRCRGGSPAVAGHQIVLRGKLPSHGGRGRLCHGHGLSGELGLLTLAIPPGAKPLLFGSRQGEAPAADFGTRSRPRSRGHFERQNRRNRPEPYLWSSCRQNFVPGAPQASCLPGNRIRPHA